MRRLAAAVAAALVCVGAAGAATFEVVPNAPALELLAPHAEQLPLDELQALWQQAGAQYGIPWTVLAAINEVESDFGRNPGPSSAGAIGPMQFMPATWAQWGVDGDGDGVADPWSAADAIPAAARYLASTGGAADLEQAVFAYNHAQWYVDEVLRLARSFAGGVQVVGDLQALQQSVEQAQQAVVAAQAALTAAQVDATEIAHDEQELAARATAASLLSDQLAFQKAAADVGAQRAQADALVAARQAELAQAQAALDAARAGAESASFDPGARSLLAGASYGDSGYVFPVGGGPGVVTVAHTHHDYPAADIAAPAGSPVYALAAGVVEAAWADDPRCGVGFTLHADDGRSWTYCHLATLDAAVVAGARVDAGAAVGLVGATGDATGPHLPLQLAPATGYPQDEPWFEAFAGSAFAWQDEQPVFAVVENAPSVVYFTQVGGP
jgi:murein DD-endopeptidase MepM/ murein hydrolase activator NlpD